MNAVLYSKNMEKKFNTSLVPQWLAISFKPLASKTCYCFKSSIKQNTLNEWKRQNTENAEMYKIITQDINEFAFVQIIKYYPTVPGWQAWGERGEGESGCISSSLHVHLHIELYTEVDNKLNTIVKLQIVDCTSSLWATLYQQG